MVDVSGDPNVDKVPESAEEIQKRADAAAAKMPKNSVPERTPKMSYADRKGA